MYSIVKLYLDSPNGIDIAVVLKQVINNVVTLPDQQ